MVSIELTKKKNLLQNLAFLLFILLSAFFFYFQIFESWYEPDEAFFLLGGALINRGFTLYEEFVDNKPPIIFMLASLIDYLSLNFTQLKITLLLISIFVFSLFYRVVEEIKSVKKSYITTAFLFSIFITSLPIISFLSLRLEQLLIYSTVLALYFYFKKSNVVLSSLFVALFPFFKPTYMIFWLLFFYLDKKFIVPTVAFFFGLLSIFFAIFRVEMFYAVVKLSLLKINGIYEENDLMDILYPTIQLSIYAGVFWLTYYFLREEIKCNKVLKFIFLFSLLYFLGLTLGLFSLGFYMQILSPFLFFFPFIFFLSFIKFLKTREENKVSLKNSILSFSFLLTFTFFLFLLATQINLIEIKNSRTYLCMGCLTKEDGEVLFYLKSSNKKVFLASKDPSIYYPYFIELSQPSIPASKVEKKDGLFPCFTGCLKILEGEYEYFVESIKKENFEDYEVIVFDKDVEINKCSGERFYCFDKEEEKIIEEKLNKSGYSLLYSGDAILVYSKN